MWFPGRHGLFFKGGVGTAYGRFSVESAPAQVDTSTGHGIGLTFGAGWDWPVNRWVSITGNVNTYVIGVGDIVLPNRRVDDVVATMYSATIGFTIR